jgi:hypothetical protein
MSFIKLEPKYCELCGALWLRPAGTDSSYCERCASRLHRMARTSDVPQGRAE